LAQRFLAGRGSLQCPPGVCFRRGSTRKGPVNVDSDADWGSECVGGGQVNALVQFVRSSQQREGPASSMCQVPLLPPPNSMSGLLRRLVQRGRDPVFCSCARLADGTNGDPREPIQHGRACALILGPTLSPVPVRHLTGLPCQPRLVGGNPTENGGRRCLDRIYTRAKFRTRTAAGGASTKRCLRKVGIAVEGSNSNV